MIGSLRAAARIVCALTLLGASAPVAVVVPSGGGVGWTHDAIANLTTELDAMLGRAATLRGAHYGLYALDTERGTVLYARGAGDEFQPASTLKLVVGSAALDRLGPNFSFHTEVRIGAGGAIDVVVGGDPFLTTDDVALAARTVARDPAARDAVAQLGPVSVATGHFDDEPYPAGWTWDDFGQAYAPRVSAAALEENLVHLIVTPGAEAGTPAVVRTRSVAVVVPASAGAAADAATCASSAGGGPLVIADARTGAPGSPDTLDVAIAKNGCLSVVGSIPLRAQADDLDGAVPDPRAYLTDTARVTLRAAGLRLTDATVLSTPHDARAGSLVWSHDSLALATFLGPRFWIPSDNLVGEVLLKELGVATAGAPGTTASGIAFEKLWLQSIGVDPATVTLADGCGMSQYDRITPSDLVAILQHDWRGPYRALVLDALPIGGVRGTIEGTDGTPVAGRVFAKTGTIKHVRGLAGYLATMHHGAVTFAFAVDDWNGDITDLAALRARVLARIVRD